jgi:hypothetical protein
LASQRAYDPPPSAAEQQSPNRNISGGCSGVLGMHRAVRPKLVPRYLAQFQWRFNRRFDLENIHRRLAYAAVGMPPTPYRLLKLPES